MNAIDLVRRFEGCRLSAYQDIAGVWTIGYGHTGKDVYEGLNWNQADAEDALAHDLRCAGALLSVYSPHVVGVPGTAAALCDFIFNLGIGNYRTSSLCGYVNAGKWEQVKAELLKWDHSSGRVVEGLLLRRQAEAELISGCAA